MLSELLVNFVNDPDCPENNYQLALYYDGIGQTASALSYYLRCAERTDDHLLSYECLLKAGLCFDKQGTRKLTAKGLLQHAVSILPKRPEAYYFLSRLYEKNEVDGHWIDSYMMASMAEKICEKDPEPLKNPIVEYPGFYGILFQKGLSSWWCGLCEESRDILKDLYENYELDDTHKSSVHNNLVKLNVIEPFPKYKKKYHSRLKYQFPLCGTIEENYSEAYQDIFVLSMLGGKTSGYYVEIGAGDPFYGNNTYLLENKFNWSGVSLDINQDLVDCHNQNRKHTCILKDATIIDYEKFLDVIDFPKNIDYLQIDCDPPETSYRILLTIPFDVYKFAVITYEHDYYCDDSKSFREKSRKYLESYGYIRVVSNVSIDDNRPYEDWWVHPDLVDEKMIKKMSHEETEILKAEDYILNTI